MSKRGAERVRRQKKRVGGGLPSEKKKSYGMEYLAYCTGKNIIGVWNRLNRKDGQAFSRRRNTRDDNDNDEDQDEGCAAEPRNNGLPSGAQDNTAVV